VNQISRICPISDDEAAAAVSREALDDLADRIMAIPVSSARGRARRVSRRRWLPASALAAALAAGLLLISSVGNPGGGLGPGNAAALSFTKRGGFIEVIVRNPVADPARYRAEFAAHDLNVRLHLVPASPSLVGTLVFFSYLSRNGSGKEIQPITAVGRCSTGGGGPVCPVGVRIPIGYRGSADITFGRAARSGELYASTTNADAQGEAMHGLRFRGRTVVAVLAMLRARHVTVPQYRAQKTNSSDVVPPDRVPGSWHVYDAVPWAPGQVLLFVGPAASPSAGAP
jgi:hypothetical protein